MDETKIQARHVYFFLHPNWARPRYPKKLKDINSANEWISFKERFYELKYLSLLMNMRQFEREELPMIKESAAFFGSFGGRLGAMASMVDSFWAKYQTPKKSKEEIEFDDRCYEMWDELDKITIVID